MKKLVILLSTIICCSACVVMLVNGVGANSDDEFESDNHDGEPDSLDLPEKIPPLQKIALLVSICSLIFVLMVSPIFSVYNVGGVVETLSQTSQAPEDVEVYDVNGDRYTSQTPDIKDYDAKAEDLVIYKEKELEDMVVYRFLPLKRDYAVTMDVIIKEGAQEMNPRTVSGLYTLPQLIVRICKDKDRPQPYQIQRVGLF